MSTNHQSRRKMGPGSVLATCPHSEANSGAPGNLNSWRKSVTDPASSWAAGVNSPRARLKSSFHSRAGEGRGQALCLGRHCPGDSGILTCFLCYWNGHRMEQLHKVFTSERTYGISNQIQKQQEAASTPRAPSGSPTLRVNHCPDLHLLLYFNISGITQPSLSRVLLRTMCEMPAHFCK